MTKLKAIAVGLAVTGCNSSPSSPSLTTTSIGVQSSTTSASASASVATATASGSATPVPTASAAPAPTEACATLATWNPWNIKRPKECKLLLPPDPTALPPLVWSACAAESGIAGCRQSGPWEARFDAARGTVATHVICRGRSEAAYVQVAELDGKVLAAIGVMSAGGDCRPSLVDHRDARWLVAVRGVPEPLGKAGTVPDAVVGFAFVGSAVSPKPSLVWRTDAVDHDLNKGFVDARGYAFEFGEWDTEQWYAAAWGAGPTDLYGTAMPRMSEQGAALGDGALFLAIKDRGMIVAAHDIPGTTTTLVSEAIDVSGVAADSKDLVFRAVRGKQCRLFASPVVRDRDGFAPRRIAESCEKPLTVGCGHVLVRGKDQFGLIRLRDGARATLKSDWPYLGNPLALSCSEAFFGSSFRFNRIPIASFGILAPPASAPAAADPDDLFGHQPDAGVGGDAGIALEVAGDGGTDAAPKDAGRGFSDQPDAAAPGDAGTKP